MNNFKECETCAAKPGSPTLCEGCLHNRALIETLKENKKKDIDENLLELIKILKEDRNGKVTLPYVPYYWPNVIQNPWRCSCGMVVYPGSYHVCNKIWCGISGSALC